METGTFPFETSCLLVLVDAVLPPVSSLAFSCVAPVFQIAEYQDDTEVHVAVVVSELVTAAESFHREYAAASLVVV